MMVTSAKGKGDPGPVAYDDGALFTACNRIIVIEVFEDCERSGESKVP